MQENETESTQGLVPVGKLHPDLAAGIIKMQQAAERVLRTARNEHGQYDYAKADDIAAEVLRAGIECDVAVVRSPPCYEYHDKKNPSDRQWVCATVHADYLILHKSGHYLGPWPMAVPAVERSATPADKAGAADMTYFHGYTLLGLFNIAREEKGHGVETRKDGNSQPVRQSQRKAKAAKKQPTANPALTNLKVLAQKYIDLHTEITESTHPIKWQGPDGVLERACKGTGVVYPLDHVPETDDLPKLNDWLTRECNSMHVDALAIRGAEATKNLPQMPDWAGATERLKGDNA